MQFISIKPSFVFIWDVNGGINFKPRKDFEITYSDEGNEFQWSWIELLNEKSPNILVGVYYRHPKEKSHNLFLLKPKRKKHWQNYVTVIKLQ